MTRDSATLKGGVEGGSRAQLMTKAAELAARYFDTECVVIELRDEERLSLDRSHAGEALAVRYAANFDSWEHHGLESRVYGPTVYRRCKKQSWPQHPLT